MNVQKHACSLNRSTEVQTWISSSVLFISLLQIIFWNLCNKGRSGALVPCAERSLSVSLVPLSQSWSNSITADNIWLKKELTLNWRHGGINLVTSISFGFFQKLPFLTHTNVPRNYNVQMMLDSAMKDLLKGLPQCASLNSQFQ